MTPIQFLRRTSAFGLAGFLILHSAVSVADDTEIFFGTKPEEGTRPNVLFILDDSGSMAWCTDNASTCDIASKTRMKVLKDTMTNLLNTTSGVNVGLMVMNNTAKTPGDASVPRLLQKVEGIDQPINVKISSPEIMTSADDASRYNGSNNISDPTLVMGHINNPGSGTITRSLGSNSTYSNDNSTYYVRGNYTCSVKMEATNECPAGKLSSLSIGDQDGVLLFRNLNIPKGVTITSASLELAGSSTAATEFDLSLADSKTPEAFNHSSVFVGSFAGSTRLTSNRSGTTHRLDLTTLLRNQQNLSPQLNPIGDLAIKLRARNPFNIAVGDVANAPVLTVTFTGSENNSRTTGLRFQTVNVPQGATITRATLNFVPASSDDRTVSFDVTAELSGNANDFSSGDFTRPKTTATSWTPAPWRTANPPVHTDQGADVTAQVQAVVNQGDWCGNNAMAFFLAPTGGDGNRTAVSRDGNNAFKPTLSISYTGGDTGCMKPIVDLSLIDDKDDARQFRTSSWWFTNNTAVSVNEGSLPFEDTYTYVGARFQQVPFKKGATVDEARLIVTPSSAQGTSVTAQVYFENTGNSSAFSSGDNNLGRRQPTSTASCTFESEGPGVPVACEAAEIKSALQAVLTRNDWTDGNALSVLIKQTSGSSSLRLHAFESSKAAAIRLQVKLGKATDLTDNTYKVRDYLKGIVSDMRASGGTPIVDLLYQGASYYTDLPGKHKGPTSPIESSCQANYLVLMTDGQANHTSSSVASTVISNAEALTGATCVRRNSADVTYGKNGETCGVEIAKWLNSIDQSSTLAEKNLVTTHTVGFALQTDDSAKKFLSDIATAGGGKAYTADDANALANAFNSIIQEALAADTTFVSATAPVNSFNRQDHKDQLYFSLFRPSNTDRWPGNLKRYRMGVQNGSPLVLDQDNAPAIDANTGVFRSNARSWWSSSNDGSNVSAGGAASKLKHPNDRNIVTNVNGDKTLVPLNTNLTPSQIGATGTTVREREQDRDNLVNYIRGFETGTNSLRQTLGDPIHSTPSLVTYGCTARDPDGNCTSEVQSAIIGTNEGFVQMFDTNTGEEQFAFMPQELLGNIKRLSLNANMPDKRSPHLYGMDNSVTVWANDANNNGSIDNGELVYAYATMGRGGRSIYALDITNRTSPKIEWIIKGGSGEFTRLGQTWSAPIKTKIKVGSTITDVLIFGGGYDPNQDPKDGQANVRRTDGMGNDLFIVNAKTGALLWSASRAGINMQYSVPSRATVIGLETNPAGQAILNQEGLATQIFVGDMGGQVWRFKINNDNNGAGNGLVSGRIFASVAGNDEASARRFYTEPAVALLSANNKVSLTVSLGSGYRGHPLDKVIQDRFYSFRSEELNNVGTVTFGEGDLYNATNLVTATDEQRNALLQKNGWYITLAANGEKVLSNTMAIGGTLYFNTYQPVVAQNACRATLGISRGYRVNLLDGTAKDQSRFTVLKGATLPSNPQVYCKGDTCWAYNDPSQLVPWGNIGGGGNTGDGKPDPHDLASKSRLYWTDKSEEK